MTTPNSLPWFRPITIVREQSPATRWGFTGLNRAIARLLLWRNRYNGRRTIRSMTSEQIVGLDLDPVAMRLEGEKPFWRA